MEKFNVLLHQISRDLRPNDLESLIHICEIEESRKATITTGHHLFTYLRHSRRISEENVHYLKQILNTIGRYDLVYLVERFEGLETTDTGRDVVNVRFEPSTSTEISRDAFQQRDIVNRGVGNIEGLSAAVCDDGHQIQIHQGTNHIPCCSVHWPCFQMSCYKIHFCYVMLTVIFTLAIITTALCWFANVPEVSEHLKAKKSVYNSGIFVIIALILAFPIVMLILFFGRKYWKKHGNVVVFSNATGTPASTVVAATLAKNEDPVPSVLLQINPSCEVEMSDEPITCGNNITTGDTEPILSQESES